MMTNQEALAFAQERVSTISYHLEMTNKLPCRSFYEKQQEMLIRAVDALKKQVPKRIGLCHCDCGMAIDNGWMYCPKCGQRLEDAK